MYAKSQRPRTLSAPRPLQPQGARLLVAASLLAGLAASGCDDADAFSEEPSSLRNSAGTIDPATGGGTPGDYEPTVPETNPDFFCPYRYAPNSGNATSEALPIPYCASAPLEGKSRYDFDEVTRLVISQHGRGSDAHMYFDRINNAAVDLEPELRGPTFVIAPQFFDMNPINNDKVNEWELDGLLWWKNGTWPNGLLSNGHSGEQFSSYTVLDGLVAKAISKMPSLREIIFVGQSAGGQTVQKYAVLSDATYPASVNVRYVPANPFVYAYVDEQRSDFGFGQQSPYDHVFETPDANSPFPWGTPLVCPALVGESPPESYNDWANGLDDAPSYSGNLNEAQQQVVRNRYLDRDVTYLIGEDDMFTDANQCGGSTQVQGKHRRRRAETYAAHVQQLGADHELVKVPDFGHGSTMFNEDCVRRVIFGLGNNCNAMEDQLALTNWDGDIVEVAAFEADDGDNLPEVIVARRSGGVDRLYLVDDVDHGFAFLADITPAWGVGAQVTGLEVAHMTPDAPGADIVVGVSGGDGGWYLLGADGGDVLEFEAGGQGQDIVALTAGELSSELGREIVVAWDATQGERWRALGWDGAAHVPVASGTYAGAARPVAVEVEDYAYDDTHEVAIALDSTTGPRLVLADTLGNHMMIDPGWSDGQRIVDAETSSSLGVDGQATRELVLATVGGDRPWVVLEEDPDAPGTLTQVLESPEAWPQGVEPTSISVEAPFWKKTTVAVGRTGPVDGHAVLYTYKRDTVQDEDVPVLGDVRVEALGLGEDAEVPGIAFADLDRLGSDEVLIGRAGHDGFGYRLRVLSAL